MPELPEVEFARRALSRWFEGRRLVRAVADRTARTFRGADVKAFERLAGPLTRADRRGKYLLLAFGEGQGLLAHLGMTGKFLRRPAGEAVPWSRARLELDSGEVVHFRDPRFFGFLKAMPEAALAADKAVAALGIDPVVDGLTVAQLKGALGSSRQPLKVALMDQGRLAGLGNIHAAEALFRARLHPARTPVSLAPAEWSALRRGIHASLKFGLSSAGEDDDIAYVEEPGTSNPFKVYGRAGTRCTRCKTATVKAFTQGGRTTHFCPHCQPARPARRGTRT
jgi:formamidopyrimidine-DNA glycosylase